MTNFSRSGSMLALVLGAGMALSACATFAPAKSVEDAQPADSLAQLIGDYDAWTAERATGRRAKTPDAWARLPDVTPEARAEQRATLTALQARLNALPAASSGDNTTNQRILARVLAERIERLAWDEDRIPFDNSYGFHTTAADGLFDDDRSIDDQIARLEAMPAFLDASIANMQRGLNTDMVASGAIVDLIADAIALLRRRVAALPESAGDLEAEDRARLTAALLEADAAYGRAELFLRETYRPAIPALRGASANTDGKGWYESLARYHTASELTPDEIHALGLSEVARIRAEMEAEIAASGFEGSFADYLTFLRSDPQFYATSAEDLMEKAALLSKRIDDKMPELFATLPRLSYGVRPVPEDIAPGYTTGRYWPGSPEHGRAGGYMVNTFALKQRPLYELPALTLHEAVPGHHHQIALAQELADVPEFRRNYQPTAFVEGWALYAESLGEDIDYYQTPHERFGRLSFEMWRACRLVADTGIHWKGWSVVRARECFDENTALAPLNITTELERYVAWPGQALAYKVGELEFQRLRDEAEAALGEDFDLRAFHDVLLGQGALPFDMIEANVDNWIRTRSTTG